MSDFDRQVKDLLTRAMERPGVRDVMAAQETVRPAIEVLERAQQAVAPRWVVSTTSSTTYDPNR